jgi:transketolase
MCYEAALTRKDRPSALIFTRQNLPLLERRQGFAPEEILKGAYVVSGEENDKLVIVATGSETWLAVEAAKSLATKGIKARVVSMPCMELFLEQPEPVRNQIIPPGSKRVSIEAGITLGWERITGAGGLTIGLDHYGASAPGEIIAEKFGFTPKAVEEKITKWLK